MVFGRVCFGQKYGFVPSGVKRATYLSTISRMLFTGLIERKINKSGKPILILTSKGTEEYKRKFPIFTKANNKWDGWFVQVAFDIPEKESKTRKLLRTKLKELGFGMLQESVFISPYHFESDLKEFLDYSGLSDYVYVMKVKNVVVGDLVGWPIKFGG